ncbi:hypothetical protein Tco_1293331 [Tanacetum coccineum]
MLAPSGRGLIIYQAYGNLYAMTERGDGVAIIKRRRQDLNGDGVRDLATASGRGRLKADPEPSTWRLHQDVKVTPSHQREDGVAIIKRRRQDLNGDGVKDLATTSGRGRLKAHLEPSTWRRHQDLKVTPSHQGDAAVGDRVSNGWISRFRSAEVDPVVISVVVAILQFYYGERTDNPKAIL